MALSGPRSRLGEVDTAPNGLRRLPLRIAGSIGLVASLIYLGGVLGQDDTTFMPQAIFWFLVMSGAGLTAWFADRSLRHGRRMAIGAAGAFFVVGLFSNVVFAVVFAIALVFAIAGFVGLSGSDEGKPLEA